MRSLLTPIMTSVLTSFLALGCSNSEPPAYVAGQPPIATPKVPLGTIQERGLNIIWFGHSLLQVGSDTPIDIPETMKGIHAEALRDGRTRIPQGESRTHYEGPHNLDYWFNGRGAAPQKLRANNPGWDYVVGVGFMHLVGPGRAHSGLFNTLRSVSGGSERFKTYAAYTPVKYEAIQAVAKDNPNATWVNYVGPRLSDNPQEQPFVDERFECIRETAESAGKRTLNVPVGRAFRAAEAAGKAQPALGITLQLPDKLHLTKQGEYLAANVFYRFFYGVDPVGLRVPDGLAGRLTVDPKKEAEVAALLQRVARDTVDAYEAGDRLPCRPQAKLDEDEAGRALLEGGGG
jgi:hypothetical protein